MKAVGATLKLSTKLFIETSLSYQQELTLCNEAYVMYMLRRLGVGVEEHVKSTSDLETP